MATYEDFSPSTDYFTAFLNRLFFKGLSNVISVMVLVFWIQGYPFVLWFAKQKSVQAINYGDLNPQNDTLSKRRFLSVMVEVLPIYCPLVAFSHCANKTGFKGGQFQLLGLIK